MQTHTETSEFQISPMNICRVFSCPPPDKHVVQMYTDPLFTANSCSFNHKSSLWKANILYHTPSTSCGQTYLSTVSAIQRYPSPRLGAQPPILLNTCVSRISQCFLKLLKVQCLLSCNFFIIITFKTNM